MDHADLVFLRQAAMLSLRVFIACVLLALIVNWIACKLHGYPRSNSDKQVIARHRRIVLTWFLTITAAGLAVAGVGYTALRITDVAERSRIQLLCVFIAWGLPVLALVQTFLSIPALIAMFKRMQQ